MNHPILPVSDRVRAIVARHLNIDVEQVRDGSGLAELGCDSLDRIELIVACEDEFGISIDDGETDDIHTVGDAIARLEKRMAANV